jgi:DNA-binding transcriptional ArsR family regulator
MINDKVFKALSDSKRRKILQLLRQNVTMTAGEISDCFDISKPAISDHLKLLKGADLIYSEKKGQYIFYSLNASIFEHVVSFFLEFVSKD